MPFKRSKVKIMSARPSVGKDVEQIELSHIVNGNKK